MLLKISWSKFSRWGFGLRASGFDSAQPDMASTLSDMASTLSDMASGFAQPDMASGFAQPDMASGFAQPDKRRSLTGRFDCVQPDRKYLSG
jgi:hypothetical protein